NPVGESIARRGQARVLVDHLHHRPQALADITNDGNVRHLDLVDLGWIDVDVYDLAVLRKLPDLAGDTVVEADAEGQEQVGLVDGVVGVHGAVHSEHLQAQEVIAGKATQAMDGEGDRDSGLFGKSAQPGRSSGGDDAAASVDDRPAAGTNRRQH